MTLNELKNDVARLGFESYVEDDELFIASANRALSLIYVDRPVSNTARLTFSGPRTTLVKEFIEHKSEEVITIPFSGRSLSFRSSGKGTCVITDRTGSNTVPLTNDGQLTKQFVYGEGTIVLSGDFYFTVSNLAVFDSIISNNTPDIPEYTPERELMPEEYCDDFRAFSGRPCDKNGYPVDCVRLRDGRIVAPFSYRDEIYLTYYRTPQKIDPDRPEGVIDVSEECAPMLPLLTASFLWLDEDAAKAQYYMSLYRDLMANVKRFSTNRIDTEYRVNGWA